MKKKKSERSKLIKKYLEHRSRKDWRTALGHKQRGRGIYVLYKKRGKIYYIGLSKRSLRSRIRKRFFRDKKWREFSFYQIGRTKYIKDIETLLLRICRPPGNKVGGRFSRKYDLSRRAK